MIRLLAQVTGGEASALAGASGWAGAGLLGLVLAWLMLVHLPAVFKAHKDEMATKDALVTKLVDNFREEMQKERDVAGRFGDLLLANTSETRLLSAAITNLAQQAGLVITGPAKH